jgi:hypothetical protein
LNIKVNWKWVYRVFFTLIAWYGVIGHYFQIVVDRAPGVTFIGATIDYFSYFTIQSNWLVAIWWTLAIFSANSSVQRWFLSPKVKGALTAYITVTFAVYAVLLANMWQPTGYAWLYANITHYVTPLAFIGDWLLFEQRGVYRWNFLPVWLLYPVVYFAYALIYGAITHKALYFFFDYTQLGWGGMIFQVALLLAFFIGLSALYIGLNRLLGKLAPVSMEKNNA